MVIILTIRLQITGLRFGEKYCVAIGLQLVLPPLLVGLSHIIPASVSIWLIHSSLALLMYQATLELYVQSLIPATRWYKVFKQKSKERSLKWSNEKNIRGVSLMGWWHWPWHCVVFE